MRWSRQEVSNRLHEAWDTLRRVPANQVPGFVSSWPAYIRDVMEASGFGDIIIRLTPASPQAIDRMHEVFTWFACLEGKPHLTMALWLTCGMKLGPKRAGAIIGVHRDTVRMRRDQALDLMAASLNTRRQAA